MSQGVGEGGPDTTERLHNPLEMDGVGLANSSRPQKSIDKRHLSLYVLRRCMITKFRHRGLQRLFERGDRSKIRPDLVAKVERVLARLDASAEPKDMDAPGFGLHAMTGDRRGFWSVVVSRNWRVIFRFEGGDASDVDFIDYH